MPEFLIYINNKMNNIYGLQLENTYALQPAELYKHVLPTPSANPSLLLWNDELAVELNLDFSDILEQEKAEIFCGNIILENTTPIAQAYSGHQFGYYNTLGDGRAILLTEHITANNKRIDIQLKGAGPTPYSRRGDGRATYYAMLREFLISEAMNGLGIATSRSLAVVKTGEKIYRESLKDSAVLTRIMQSHIRVGTFEYVAKTHSVQVLQQFTDYVIQRHFLEILQLPNKYIALLEAIVATQIKTVTQWMQFGFVHGVMNTDNTFISGETADYGPCAFINIYNPNAVFSSIDANSRYAFGNQSAILQWNLASLATCLLPLIHTDSATAIELAQNVIHSFPALYDAAWLQTMAKKIGLQTLETEDKNLIQILLDWMQQHEADYTNTFLYLQNIDVPNNEKYSSPLFNHWVQLWHARLAAEHTSLETALATMALNNPIFIPRNHIVEEVLLQATEHHNLEPFMKFLQVLQHPFVVDDNKKYYMQSVTHSEEIQYKTYCGT
jgi:serine/tyrosine/threonine adenylyltransferase